MKIKKRDGRIVAFDQNKIIDAVLAAFQDVDGELSDYAYVKAGNIADYILETAEAHKEQQIILWEKTNPGVEIDPDLLYLGVEEIQDLVEKGLMATKRKDVAKAYILYREDRNKVRAKNSDMIRQVGDKLNASAVENQNANLDEFSFGGRKGEAANVLTKQYALDYIVSPMARSNHLNNEIYIHDLDSYAIGMHNCLSVPFDDLLANGFNTRQTDVRPANSVNTAFQLVAVLFQLQSLQQFGGVSATHLDWTMVPYVRKSFWKHFKDGLKYAEQLPQYKYVTIVNAFDHIEDISITSDKYQQFSKAYQYAIDMTIRETHQAVEGMYHNLKVNLGRLNSNVKNLAA